MRTLQLLALAFAILGTLAVPLEGQEQPRSSTLKVAPAWFQSTDASAPGFRWEARFAKSRIHDDTTRFPTTGCRELRTTPELEGEFSSEGATAIDPNANADPLHAAAKGSLWWSLYKPGCAGPNPSEPPSGGYYYGSVLLSVHARGESNQRFSEVMSLFGVDVLWTHGTHRWWRLIPSLMGAFSAAAPIRSTARDSAGLPSDMFRRGELHATWVVPLRAFVFYANVRGWKSWGLDAALDSAGASEGLFHEFDLARKVEWRVGPVPITEFFVRRVGGEAPVEWRQRRTWMAGIVTGR